MNNLLKIAQNKLLIFFIILLLFGFKIFLNNFLKAENGDTYDFFRISYELSQGNVLYESKRLPLYSLLLVPFNPDNYVLYGRIINNLIYFLSVFFFYKLISTKFRLDVGEKVVFTLIFGFNFIIFDNSFYILSDSLLLLFGALFLFLYEKNYSAYLLSFIAVLAFYTRFEGILLLIGFLFLNLYKKNYADVIKSLIFFSLLCFPLILKILLTGSSGANYINDEAGFTLKYQNILKALGSVFYATGGFWLLSLFILDKKTQILAKNPLKSLKLHFSNLYVILFVLFSTILVLWGFFIRLYSFIALLSILFLIYLYKSKFEFSKNYKLLIFPVSFFIINLQFLDHFDLGYFKFSKFISIIISFLLIYLFVKNKNITKKSLYLASFLIILLNLIVFAEKFLSTRLKYQTIIQASEYANQNKLENVAYFDESGVQKWYFKDFSGKYQYFKSDYPLLLWLSENNINYLMITDEMGYKIAQIKELNSEIKSMGIVKEFTSDYVGGRTVIYKYQNTVSNSDFK